MFGGEVQVPGALPAIAGLGGSRPAVDSDGDELTGIAAVEEIRAASQVDTAVGLHLAGDYGWFSRDGHLRGIKVGR